MCNAHMSHEARVGVKLHHSLVVNIPLRARTVPDGDKVGIERRKNFSWLVASVSVVSRHNSRRMHTLVKVDDLAKSPNPARQGPNYLAE